MSLNKYQQPVSTYSGSKYVHQSTYPEYYTAISDLYSGYTDFKYKFKIYTSDGLLSTSKNPPYVNDGVGINNPVTILKQQLYSEFDPTITTYKSKPGSMINYRIDVEEFSKDISVPDTDSFTKCRMLRCWKEDFDYTNYLMRGATTNYPSYFLTNWRRQPVKVHLNQYATLRCLSGTQKATAGTYPFINSSFVYQLSLFTYDSVGNRSGYTLQDINPYWPSTGTPDTDNDVLEDMDGYVLEIPTGPLNINGLKWKFTYYLPVGGVSTYIGTSSTADVITSNVTRYEIRTYQWPQGTNGVTSEDYKYEVVCERQPFEGIQLAYENELGGFDYLNCPKARQQDLNITQSTYRNIRDTQGSLQGSKLNDNKYIGHSDYDRGESVFNTSVDEIWECNTDWLNSAEILDIQDLWTSENIFAYIDESWYPVISLIDKQVISTTKKGLRQYSISFRKSNKKYIN